MNRWKLMKDLPGIKAGTVGEYSHNLGDVRVFRFAHNMTFEESNMVTLFGDAYMVRHPDFFEVREVAPPMTMTLGATYLGDSVYVDRDAYGIVLTTNNGFPDDPRNVIHIDQTVWHELVRYAKRIYEIKMAPGKSPL
jgi:hypothetical protein